jgi:hypothetical protein
MLFFFSLEKNFVSRLFNVSVARIYITNDVPDSENRPETLTVDMFLSISECENVFLKSHVSTILAYGSFIGFTPY